MDLRGTWNANPHICNPSVARDDQQDNIQDQMAVLRRVNGAQAQARGWTTVARGWSVQQLLNTCLSFFYTQDGQPA